MEMMVKEKPETQVKDELERICQKNHGILRPEQVVEEAKAKQSPLHKYFKWDDTEAARLYRIEQARHLIRVTVTLIETPDRGPIEVRPFISLVPDRKEGDSYRRIIDVMNCAEHREQAVEQARRELVAIKKKYGLYSELAKVWDVIRELE